MLYRHIRLSIIATGLVAATSAPGLAADIPIKAPGVATASTAGGVYFWADGSAQSIRLPTYDIGTRLLPVAPGSGISAANTYDPRATGYGISGGLGFVLPPGVSLSNIGTNGRIEFSGSYVNATASQAATAVSTLGSGYSLPQVGGITNFAGSVACGAGTSCVVSSTLGTSYSSWQVSGRYATDFKVSGVIITPSLAVFGGKSRNSQTLSETNLVFGGTASVHYDADTKLDWTDWGARAGLSGSVPVTDWLTFVAGGNAGLAVRRVSLTGSDSVNVFVGGVPFFAPTFSATTSSATTTAFVANAEASVNIKLAPSWALRAFGGLNYDNKVPGVSAPAVVLPFGFGGASTPAGVKYQAETSYYAGGGLTVRF
ncbi:hypothetical protein [Bradyrhizobium sp. TM233]|uniref:hypothetical protein n=1 Tax=Bradyrhizobium sp. TM233 TaxID=2599801 RepID=UPI0030C7207E